MFGNIFRSVCILIIVNFILGHRQQENWCSLKGRLQPDHTLAAIQNMAENCTPGPVSCDPHNVFYSFNGSCNNLRMTNWGQAGMPFSRLIPANYADGMYKLRTAADGSPLPLARLIRTTLLPNRNISDALFTIFFYGFGQFVSHDMGLARTISDSSVNCCVNGRPSPQQPDDVCLPIIIPPNDYHFSKLGISCLEVKRVVNTRRSGCGRGAIFLINGQTSYLDLSFLYGPSEQTVRQLRLFKGGQLNVSNNQQTNFQSLPPITSGVENCPTGGIDRNAGSSCFQTGDPRANQNPEMLSVYVIFLRFHNYIASRLQKLNPSWSDELLFPNARRITIAMYQHVLWSYVLLLVGPDVASLYDLIPAREGYVNKYEPSTNPQTLHSFTSASSRSQHSNIEGLVRYKESDGLLRSYLLRDKFFNHRFLLGKNVFENIIEAYTSQACQKQDQFYVEDISDMFYSAGTNQSVDLISIDILRGRDFGLQPYNRYREACGLCRLNSFKDLSQHIANPEDIKKFESLYKTVDDIDFYVGALAEKPLKGAIVGPTFACALAEAFSRVKFGDRFYYEFPSAKFTLPQLQIIRSITIEHIVCLSMTNKKHVKIGNVFTKPRTNVLSNCEFIPDINLSAWKI